jgi:hypothetical protein
MNIESIEKFRYEIRGQNEVPVRYTCLFRALTHFIKLKRITEYLVQLSLQTDTHCVRNS